MEKDVIERLKSYAEGERVELSPFTGNEPFTVRLKRPSLLQMASAGCIPNPLLGVAQEVFLKGNLAQSGINLTDIGDLLILIARNALVEPTFQELEDCNLSLTDLQLIEIFNYTQTGVKSLENFRKVKADSQSD